MTVTKYLCNLIIPGTAKSGTSSLHGYLDQHPGISMSFRKEPHHFCRKPRYDRGAEAHNELFFTKPGVSIFGESSTGYFPCRKTIERIKNSLTTPKIIILLRDPIERLFSHYRWRYRLGLEKRNLILAVEEDGEGYDPERPDNHGFMAYLEFSKYSQFCPMWADAFGQDRVKFIFTEQLKRDSREVLGQTFRFLDVEPFEVSDRAPRNVTEVQPRRSPSALSRAGLMVPQALRNTATFSNFKRNVLLAIARHPPKEMTMAERKYLESRLVEDIKWYKSVLYHNE